MIELLASLALLAALIGLYLFMFRAARGPGGPARTWSALRMYDEAAWGVALLSGFAVSDIIQAVGSWGASGSSVEQLAGLGTLLTAAVAWSCGAGASRSVLVAMPAALVGGFAAIVKSAQAVRDAAAGGDWLLVGMVVALGLLFGFLLPLRFALDPHAMAGLAWYTALEVMVLLAGPFGVTLRDLTGWGQAVLVLLSIGIPIALALLPSIVLNLFASAAVLAEFYLSFLGLGRGFSTAVAFVVVALICYLIGAWMRRRGWVPSTVR